MLLTSVLIGKFCHFKHLLFIHILNEYLLDPYFLSGTQLGPGHVTIYASYSLHERQRADRHIHTYKRYIGIRPIRKTNMEIL